MPIQRWMKLRVQLSIIAAMVLLFMLSANMWAATDCQALKNDYEQKLKALTKQQELYQAEWEAFYLLDSQVNSLHSRYKELSRTLKRVNRYYTEGSFARLGIVLAKSYTMLSGATQFGTIKAGIKTSEQLYYRIVKKMGYKVANFSPDAFKLAAEKFLTKAAGWKTSAYLSKDLKTLQSEAGTAVVALEDALKSLKNLEDTFSARADVHMKAINEIGHKVDSLEKEVRNIAISLEVRKCLGKEKKPALLKQVAANKIIGPGTDYKISLGGSYMISHVEFRANDKRNLAGPGTGVEGVAVVKAGKWTSKPIDIKKAGSNHKITIGKTANTIIFEAYISPVTNKIHHSQIEWVKIYGYKN